MKRLILTPLLAAFYITCLQSQPTFGTKSFIDNEKGSLSIYSEKGKAGMLISSSDWPGVKRAFTDLQSDIEKVTSYKPALSEDKIPKGKELIVAGTIGKSSLIDELITRKKIDVSDVSGKWETFVIQVVEKPFRGVSSALVIAGSDKRGTIYGIYEVSRQIGVSPWHFWADVPVKHSNSLIVTDGRFVQREPSVK